LYHEIPSSLAEICIILVIKLTEHLCYPSKFGDRERYRETPESKTVIKLLSIGIKFYSQLFDSNSWKLYLQTWTLNQTQSISEYPILSNTKVIQKIVLLGVKILKCFHLVDFSLFLFSLLSFFSTFSFNLEFFLFQKKKQVKIFH